MKIWEKLKTYRYTKYSTGYGPIRSFHVVPSCPLYPAVAMLCDQPSLLAVKVVTRPTALAVVRYHRIIFSFLTSTLTCRGLDGDGRR